MALPRSVSLLSPSQFLSRAKARKGRIFSTLFAQTSFAFIVLSYPLFLQFGAYAAASGEPSAKGQFDFCRLLSGEPAQSCAVTTRFLLREIQAAAGDERACLQVASTSKVLFHPWKRANWDRVMLIGYAAYYWRSERLSKRIKARIAQFMLDAHRTLDEQCNKLNVMPAG